MANDRLRAAFDGHFDFVWRSLLRLGAPAGAVDDLAQEVFVVLSRRLEAVLPGNEKAFLFGTAVRVVSEERRAQRRRGIPDAQPVEALADPAPGPEAQLDRRRARELADEVLMAMSEELRVVFILHELEDMTMAEIATLLAVPPGTVASRLRRARDDFQARTAHLRKKP